MTREKIDTYSVKEIARRGGGEKGETDRDRG